MKPAAELTEAEALDELTALADEMAAHDVAYPQQAAPTIPAPTTTTSYVDSRPVTRCPTETGPSPQR